MSRSLEVSAVGIEREARAVADSQASPQVSAENPVSNKEKVNPDAVVVSLSQPTVAKDEKKAIRSEEQALEHAKKIAETLKKAAEQFTATKVTFDVSIQQEGRASLSFQVVDTRSGEVVRQFPPDILKSIDSQLDEVESGVLVKELA